MSEKKPNQERKADRTNPVFDRFEDLTKKLLKVPEEEADEEQRKYEKERDLKRAG